jgi:ABC-type nitrate/sulfonate/bicarbonate transport system substrate-binding protein
MKRLLVAAVCFSSFLFLFLLTVTEAQKSAPTPQVLRVICLPARPLALTVAHDQGLLAKYAVDVQGQVAANSDELRTGLALGKFDIAHAAVDNAVAMNEKSGADVIVVLGGEGSTNELLAQRDIHSVTDLRGHTVIVDAPNTAYAIQLKKILLLQGLEPDRDYQIKPIGATPARLAAMREHKEYAASILGPPTSLLAKQQGLFSLGSTQQLLGPYQGLGAFARKSWANENGVLLTRYIAAYVEAQRWILDPTNKVEVVALLAREYKLSNNLASEAYTSWIVAPGGFARDAAIDLDGFRSVLELRAEIEHTWEGQTPGPEKYYDPAYYNAALSRLPARK